MENSRPKTEDSPSEREAKKARRRAIKAPLHAERLHTAPRVPERLGHVVVTGETAEPKKASSHAGETLAKAMINAESLRAAANGKRIETMSRSELLSMSEKIVVNGSSLRQIYETHLIGERGLRRLVAEHFRGGNLNETLRREIIEREIDFERDPALRDMNPDGPVDGGAHSSQVTLDKLLENASEGLPNNDEGAAFYKAQAAYHATQHEVAKKKRRLLDVGLTSAIIVLIVLLVTLYLTRH